MKEIPNAGLIAPSMCVAIGDVVKAAEHIPLKSPKDELFVAEKLAPSNESVVDNDCYVELEHLDALPKELGNEDQDSPASPHRAQELR